jgi:hypothetical protein
MYVLQLLSLITEFSKPDSSVHLSFAAVSVNNFPLHYSYIYSPGPWFNNTEQMQDELRLGK